MATNETTQNITDLITASEQASATNDAPAPVNNAGTPSTPEECSDTSVSASEGCNMLAAAESKGSGSYTAKNSSTGAAGRYQFIPSTAVEQIKKIRGISSTAEAKALWDLCGTSSTPECKKLQDDMCSAYFNYIERSLKNGGIPLTNTNRYLAWNQGTGGARAIIRSIKEGSPVTNKKILSNMQGQAWDFSADGQEFYNNMENYLQDRGVDIS